MNRTACVGLFGLACWCLVEGPSTIAAGDGGAQARAAQQILAKHCWACHGPSKQSGGLRLDAPAGFLQGGDGGAVVEPGRAGESRLIEYVEGGSGIVMPPRGDRLSDPDVRTLKSWIDQGAEWPPGSPVVPGEAADAGRHWSFQPVRRPAVPAVRDRAWVRSEIDAFVLSKLEAEGLTPAPEADPRTLIRRLSLDLRGLPPTPLEVETYVADRRPDAYERLVDRLLASPHFGERWARHWLDRARYAESSGCELDLERPYAWRWRDWVVDAVNDDMPFDRFTVEQIAGDLLPGASLEQRIATGFHRNAISNHEGGIDLEAERVKTIVDRVSAVGSAWMGLTLGCAECHSHKYDPISQTDFYRQFALFNSTDDCDVDAPGPDRRFDVVRAANELERARTSYLADPAEGQSDWEARIAALPDPWIVPRELEGSSFRSNRHAILRQCDDGSLYVEGRLPDDDSYEISFRAPIAGITAIRVEALNDPYRPESGPGRGVDRKAVMTGVAVKASAGIGSTAPAPVPIHGIEVDYCQPGFYAADALGVTEGKGWSCDQAGVPHAAVLTLRRPVDSAEPPVLAVSLAHAIGRGRSFVRFRIAVTSAANEQLAGQAVPDEIRSLLRAPVGSRDDARRAALKRYYQSVYEPRDPALTAWNDALARFSRESGATAAQVIRERVVPRPTFVHLRGDYRRRGAPVEPGLIAGLASSPTPDRPLTRLDLARWLVDPGHPLTARVAANDCWQHLFGFGLVRTPNDFGRQGDPPTHPDLLDWLADEFVRGGWGRKFLVRRIVCSATYRQSSAVAGALLVRDPMNRLLARQSRVRLEAEILRDSVLAVGGILAHRLGGPSFELPIPRDDPWSDWLPYPKPPGSEDVHRRGLYAGVRRSTPDDLLAMFDAPDAAGSCAARLRSSTPLQALTLLNDSVAEDGARALAQRCRREPSPEAGDDFDRLFLLCLARRPTWAERLTVARLFRDLEAIYRGSQDEAARLTGLDRASDGLPAAAAWFVVARTILNLDEFQTRE